MKRLPKDVRFLRQAQLLAEDCSTCIRRKVGAVVVRDNHIVATGYNGAPSKIKHCTKYSCLRLRNNIPSGQNRELCRGAHADNNAVAQAGRELCKGSTLYIYGGTPCGDCAKTIINNGIGRVVCVGNYPDNLGVELLKEAGVTLEVIDEI